MQRCSLLLVFRFYSMPCHYAIWALRPLGTFHNSLWLLHASLIKLHCQYCYILVACPLKTEGHSAFSTHQEKTGMTSQQDVGLFISQRLANARECELFLPLTLNTKAWSLGSILLGSSVYVLDCNNGFVHQKNPPHVIYPSWHGR